jgi:predicted nucleotidyltransferase
MTTIGEGMAPKTASELTPAEVERYRESLKSRQIRIDEQTRIRLEDAQRVAARAAAILKEKFGAVRVVAFGSLTSSDLFHQHSDIDLAAWGIKDRDYFRAVGVLQAVDPRFSIDLISFEDAPPALQQTILQNGVDL